MEPVRTIEPRASLPPNPCVLDATLGDSTAGLVREQGGVVGETLAPVPLPPPELPQLRHESIGHEHVRCPSTLGDLPTNAHPNARRAIWREHVADVQADDFSEAQAGAE